VAHYTTLSQGHSRRGYVGLPLTVMKEWPSPAAGKRGNLQIRGTRTVNHFTKIELAVAVSINPMLFDLKDVRPTACHLLRVPSVVQCGLAGYYFMHHL